MSPVRSLVLVGTAGLVLALGGCSYDYLQNSDRVGYHTGDAVKANMASQTVNPQKASMYDKSDLGKDGDVAPEDASASPAVPAAVP